MDEDAQIDWLGWPTQARAFPEMLSENLAPIADLVDRLADDMVDRDLAKLEDGDRAMLRSRLEALGPLGLLGAEAPADRGGAELSMAECCRIVEGLGRLGGFSVAYVAHAGLATIPLATYASDSLAADYLPRLMSGEWIGGYCLTEPGSGSDAQAARTLAVPVEGGWSLSGTKAWISNGGIADLLIVFAQFKTDSGPRFGACVIERAWPGVDVGAEEHKLGMASSSTTTVSFDSVFVPDRNVIAEIGMGAQIAFGTLNSGRMKVGAVSIGACRELLRQSIAYANGRIAFGQPIADLAAVREKLAVMAARTFALEAAVYRVATAIDDEKAKGVGRHQALASRQAEAALIKVLGSETLAYCADEAIQIHGGNGFSEEYAPARFYRDARVQRIYEGTNEVNRALAVRSFLKRWRGASPPPHRTAGRTGALRQLAEAVTVQLADGFDEAAATPAADLMIALMEAESAILRSKNAPERHSFRALAELAAAEAERRALDAYVRLPNPVKAATTAEISALFQ